MTMDMKIKGRWVSTDELAERSVEELREIRSDARDQMGGVDDARANLALAGIIACANAELDERGNDD